MSLAAEIAAHRKLEPELMSRQTTWCEAFVWHYDPEAEWGQRYRPGRCTRGATGVRQGMKVCGTHQRKASVQRFDGPAA